MFIVDLRLLCDWMVCSFLGEIWPSYFPDPTTVPDTEFMLETYVLNEWRDTETPVLELEFFLEEAN